MNRKLKYRKILLLVLFASVVFLGSYTYYLIKDKIPNEIRIIADEGQKFDFGLPVEGNIYKNTIEVSGGPESNIPENQIHLSLAEPFTLQAGATGSYVMECKLFGVFNLKSVHVSVIDQHYLIPCGLPIGIYIETDGVLVIGTGTVTSLDGMNYEPAYNLVKSGDYIISVNSMIVKDKNDLIEKINQYGNDKIVLGIRRGEELISISVDPVQTENDSYKLGVWVRDNTQGIGTLTFMDGDSRFGALGHGINDIDTSTLMEIQTGNLYETEIVSVVKGEKGKPGELSGVIDYSKESILGEVTGNTAEGVFGQGNDQLKGRINANALEIGMKQEIKTGPALIRCSVDGTIRDYEITILEIDMNSSNINKGIVLKVTDEDLLSLTGGIVQGMSGSPIIQNNKIIGAVTHVFIQDSTKGFGIFIENMIQSY